MLLLLPLLIISTPLLALSRSPLSCRALALHSRSFPQVFIPGAAFLSLYLIKSSLATLYINLPSSSFPSLTDSPSAHHSPFLFSSWFPIGISLSLPLLSLLSLRPIPPITLPSSSFPSFPDSLSAHQSPFLSFTFSPSCPISPSPPFLLYPFSPWSSSSSTSQQFNKYKGHEHTQTYEFQNVSNSWRGLKETKACCLPKKTGSNSTKDTPEGWSIL